MLLRDLALFVSVVCREVLVDDNRARRTWEFLPGEEVLDVEGDQRVIPSKGAAGFLLPLRSHGGGVGWRRRWKRRRLDDGGW